MKRIFRISAFVLAATFSAVGFCQTPQDSLSTCLVDNLSGKERKMLAKWIFFSMAAHPEIKSYAQVSLDERTANNQHVGVIVTRLLTDNCAASLKRAYSSDTNSVRKAFEFVGRVAMQELMASPEVAKSISDYAQFADLKSINKALSK